jgi:transcriptional regulator with XRE-family HTH domain
VDEDPASPPPASVAARRRRFTEEVLAVMERRGISRSELARRLGASPAYVTKILRGDANFTLASMAKLAAALEAELEIGLSATREGDRKRPAGGDDAARAKPATETAPPSRRKREAPTPRSVVVPAADWRVW